MGALVGLAQALLTCIIWVDAKSPNVVLLVLDDIGWADVGYHGGNFPTPNIDKLAKTGVELDRMYVMPQCSPTRAAIMTGRYSFRTGLQHFETLLPGATGGIPSGTPTIADTFKSAGYATHMVGKWHIGYSKWSQTPTGKGFESHYGYLQGQCDYYNRSIGTCNSSAGGICLYKVNKGKHSPAGDTSAAYDFWDDRRAVYEDFGRYTVDAYESRLQRLLMPYGSASPPEKPLFLYFAEQQLHIPLQAPPEAKYLEKCRGVVGSGDLTNRTVLCSMASRLDDSVGRLVSMLQNYGMWNNTLIFATSENGGMTQWSDIWPASASSNWPLRGGKTTVFEGGVRAMAFVSGGALPPAARGTQRSTLMHAVDILPTLASFAGVPLLGGDRDGLDAWPAIASGASFARTEIPLNIGVNPLGGLPSFFPGHLVNDGGLNYSALISWPWKVIVGDPYIPLGANMAKDRRRDGWWTVDGYEYKPPPDDFKVPMRLYNLENDESEEHNVAGQAEHAELLKSLLARVEYYASKESGWVKPQFNMPMPLGNPRFHNWTWAPFHLLEEPGEASEFVI
ncbi:unnamed protein product [Polarella glacialis]|uniref:Sulfatase N-terminal domain-containing protein n=2 Tax=Polarella glacialis TaxID=89957 RepID=A0A813FJM0_POLGL|nr:unnamed protein product [Polarella glacialis]